MTGSGRGRRGRPGGGVQLDETATRLELVSPMATGLRAVLVLVGLLPLYAPYDLLVRTDWNGYFNVVFAFTVLISVGAVAVSLGFLAAGLTGLGSSIVLDAARGELVHSAGAPAVRRRTQIHPLASAAGAEIRTREWSEGEPTYAVAVLLSDGTAYETGSVSSRDEAEALLRRVERFLSWHAGRSLPRQ